MINKKQFVIPLTICFVLLVSCIFIQSNKLENQNKEGSISEKSTAELIQILEQAENVNNPAFNLFLDVVDELEKRGQSASEAAPTLAKAIAYDRRDSGVAGRALIPMGQSATTAIPILLRNLDNKREDVRLYSAINLGFIGIPAECSIPKLGNLLWDEDSGVRSVAAAAIEAIVKVDLVESDEEIDPELYGSINLDDPEGSITKKARTWWQETGKNMEWSEENCMSTKE
jgi:hypothetical protein